MTNYDKELQKIQSAAYHFAPQGSIVAGGALTSVFTNKEIADVDLYFKSKRDFILGVGYAYENGMWCVAATNRAVTFVQGDSIVQLMHFDFFPEANDIFSCFDFTVNMAAYDNDKKEFIFHDDFLKHCSQRFLRFHNGTRYPYGSLMRVLKYQQKGYTIGKSDLLRIGLMCSQVEINSWEELADAVGGQYGEKVKLNTDKPYSLEAALEEFSGDEFHVKAQGEEFPGNAYDLLEKIGIKAEEFVNEEDVEYLKGW